MVRHPVTEPASSGRIYSVIREWGAIIFGGVLAVGLLLLSSFSSFNLVNLPLGLPRGINASQADDILVFTVLIFTGLGIDRWLALRRGRERLTQMRAEMAEEQEHQSASDEQFRQLADNIHEVFFSLTPNPARITYISPAYDAIWGRTREEIYRNPKAWIESIHREDQEKAGEFFAEAMKGAQLEMDYRVVRPDGSIRWISARTFPVRDKRGRLVRVVGIAEDITARREALERLQAALAIAEEQAQETTRLTELLDILQSCQSTEEAYRVIQESLPRALSTRAGALCITSPSRNIVEATSEWGDDLGTERTFRPDDCWALRRGKMHGVNESLSSPRCAHVKGVPEAGYLCVPLAAQGETLGVLYLESKAGKASLQGDGRKDELEELGRKATAAGERISLALANLRLREVLRGQSLRDPLTGLFNRRYMEETLEREVQRGIRNKQPVALLMLDIDHFKRFNDTFGHQAGDAMLRLIGDFLGKRTRGQDAACRYGGEEFAVILSGAPIEAAQRRAELLREEVKQLAAEYAGQALGGVTLSIGIAAYPEHTTTEDLLRAADQALYRAKSEGRDRTIVG